MKLPINIEELLGGRAVEGDRIEYKTGWNPDAIYRSVCAFANFDQGERRAKLAWAMPSQSKVNYVNDFDETGGGYIVVGVVEKNGRPVRPVVGIDPDQIEPIEKDMVGFNNLMRTYFLIDIPCHPEFLGETLTLEHLGVNDVTKASNVTKDVTKDVTKELSERQQLILEMVNEDAFVTISEMSLKTGVATRTIIRDIEELQTKGILIRVGGRKEGHWVIVKNNE